MRGLSSCGKQSFNKQEELSIILNEAESRIGMRFLKIANPQKSVHLIKDQGSNI